VKEPHESQSDQRVQTACLLILAFVAAGIALYLLRPVLVPFVLALFFAYCLAAVIDALVLYLRLPQALAVLATVVLGLAVLGLVGLLVAVSVAEMSDELKTYGTQLDRITAWIAQAVPLERLGMRPDAQTGDFFTIPQETVTAFISAVLSEVTALISKGALVVIFVVLLLVGRKAATGSGGLLAEIAGHVKRYTIQMVLLSALTGILVGATLAALGVRFALVFGFLAFLLNFIPTVGAIVATLLPVPLVVLSPDLSTATQVLAVAIPGVIQAAIGNFIQPRVLGRSFGLHPVAILLALIFFGMIWGLVGAFLATPITAVIKIILERIPATRFAAALLAGTYGDDAGEPSGQAT
jgi:AI-2 transport protein TqsA